jgi:hypothetical protein
MALVHDARTGEAGTGRPVERVHQSPERVAGEHRVVVEQ